MDAELRAFLHDFVDAATGPGTRERLHEALDAVGKAAEAEAPAVVADVVKAIPFA